MDRIRKALDLARQERERSPDRESVARLGHAEQATRETFEPRAAPGVLSTIVYTNTRVFIPDQGALESNRIINPGGDGAAASAFRMLRTQVLQRMDENGWRSVAVLSPTAQDGKTTMAINLAVSMANDRRHTVLLVDCDLRRPGIGNALGIHPEFGVDDLLRGEARVEQCLYHPEGIDRLVILPAREGLSNSSEALAGPQGRELVADLRGRYPERIIVFDLPPVLSADDALAFLPLVECGLVVITERSTRRDDLLRCMELLRKTPILGTVLNKATDLNSGYG
jgi:Mrp family chromosome partitioning ATPase